MPADLFPVDEPAISLNDHPRRTPWWRRPSRWLAARTARPVGSPNWTSRKPVDWWGLAQAGGAGSFVYGAIVTFGVGLGLLIAGAAVFIGATLIETLGGS